MSVGKRMAGGVGKWVATMMITAFLFFVLIPQTRPGTAGSPFRFIFVLYDNMGLTFYEFFGFLYFLILLMGAYAWIVKA